MNKSVYLSKHYIKLIISMENIKFCQRVDVQNDLIIIVTLREKEFPEIRRIFFSV